MIDLKYIKKNIEERGDISSMQELQVYVLLCILEKLQNIPFIPLQNAGSVTVQTSSTIPPNLVSN